MSHFLEALIIVEIKEVNDRWDPIYNLNKLSKNVYFIVISHSVPEL
jgi:hypothetical protein